MHGELQRGSTETPCPAGVTIAMPDASDIELIIVIKLRRAHACGAISTDEIPYLVCDLDKLRDRATALWMFQFISCWSCLFAPYTAHYALVRR